MPSNTTSVRAGRVAGSVAGPTVASVVVAGPAATAPSASPEGWRGVVGSGVWRVGRWRNRSLNWSVRNVGVRGLRSTRSSSKSSVRCPLPNSNVDPSGDHASSVLSALATNDTCRGTPPTAGIR